MDAEWPLHLKKALWALWGKYAEQREGRMSDAIDSAFEKLCLGDEKKELQKTVQSLQEQLNLNLEMRTKAEKEVEELKQEKKHLEYVIADLMKAADVNKQNLKKLTAILSEEDCNK